MAIFLDANVFMYAAGGEHPHKDPCVKLLDLVADAEPEPEFISNVEVLQEILHRYHAIQRPELADAVFSNVVSLPIRFLPVRIEELYFAKRLLSDYSGLSTRDAIHAAGMKNANVERICSYDKGFDALPFVTRLEPEVLLRKGAR